MPDADTFRDMPTSGRLRTQLDGSTVVELDGDADLGTLPQLQQLLARAVDTASTGIVVDLDGVTVLDDAALGLIVGAAAAARRRDVGLRLICTEPRRRAYLAETRVDRIIPVDEPVDRPNGDGTTV